jgi:hypothetical protein
VEKVNAKKIDLAFVTNLNLPKVKSKPYFMRQRYENFKSTSPKGGKEERPWPSIGFYPLTVGVSAASSQRLFFNA